MKTTIAQTFRTVPDAERAIERLEELGFTHHQISVVASDNSIGQSFNLEQSTKAPEGGILGATAGGLIGAIAAGLGATGVIAIPGINLLVYGTLFAAAAGAGAGATLGGLAGALVGAGIPEFEAKRYENEVKDGAVLVAVETESAQRKLEAKTILGV